MAAIDRRLEVIDERYPEENKSDQAEEPLVDRMIRKPTEADFDDLLSVEGDLSHDIVGTGVSEGTGVSNASLGPNG